MSSRAEIGAVPVVDVVVLAYGEEPWLEACLKAVLSSTGVEVRVQLVDNGSPEAAEAAGLDERIQLHSPGRNTGYAGGCVLAAASGQAPYLAFVNSDAVVEPSALRALIDGLADPSVGLVTGCVLLAGSEGVLQDPDGQELVNAAGNPVHWLGFSWAGGYRDPLSLHLEGRDVASVSGALFAVRREVWAAVGGFDSVYFAYHEDVDLSLRVWRGGLRVRYVPTSRCAHHYEFSRHSAKLALLERNRLMTVLTVYPVSLLVRVLPMLVVTEAGVVASALRHGWGRSKLQSWAWLVRHRGHLARRRRAITGLARADDERWIAQLDNSLSVPEDAPGTVPGVVRLLLGAYWRTVSRSTSRSGSH